jgi:glycosyltransferase involved in cell wall biosynthesis
MLSVCIPVYNKNITKLLTELMSQAKSLAEVEEIIILDDGSSVAIFDQTTLLEKVKIISNPTPHGRSAARNRLLNEAIGPYVLMLDSGSVIGCSAFLSTWIAELNRKKGLVYYGGSAYASDPPEDSYFLRWKVSTSRESKSFEFRKKNASTFKTNNVVIHQQVFAKVRFNEKLIQYGHEDTLFGFELSEKNIEVFQVNNPVINELKDSNEEFLHKTKAAIENLVLAAELASSSTRFRQQIKLYDSYLKLKRFRLCFVLSWLDKAAMNWLTSELLKGRSWSVLRKYDLYKLILLNRILKVKA